jgi:putative colanic acid biosynthesis glycosyltransferase
MRVLQINASINSGSTGRIAEDIGNVLLSKSHESYIAGARGIKISTSNLIAIGGRIDLYYHGFISLFLDRHGFGSKRATRKLLKEIERIKPDVLVLHNIHGYYLNIELLFKYIAASNIPVLWTLHDCWSFTGHCTFFDSVNCEKWKTQCNNCPKTRMYPKSLFLDNSFSNFNNKKRIFGQAENIQIVTPSIWLKKLVELSFLKQPVRCIHNGIDLNKFSPSKNNTQLKIKLGLTTEKVVLGVASIWDKRKGLEDFLELASLLTEEYKIVLVGLNKNQIKNLPSNVLGINRTESVTELASYYSLASVFVNPTYQDNFPTTNIEALACGTPVITYNTGGSPEAVDEETGVVVSKGNVIELKKAIIQFASYNNEMLSIKCRERAEKHFDKENRFLDYLTVFEELIQNNNCETN